MGFWQAFTDLDLAASLSDCCCCFNSCFYCSCTSWLLLYTVKCTQSLWLSHKVNSDVSTRSWQTSLPHSWLASLSGKSRRRRGHRERSEPDQKVWKRTKSKNGCLNGNHGNESGWGATLTSFVTLMCKNLLTACSESLIFPHKYWKPFQGQHLFHTIHISFADIGGIWTPLLAAFHSPNVL